jgi:hypothetical protein
MTTETEIFEPYAAYERAVEVLTHEGWGNIIGDPLTWKPEGVPKDVGLQFSVFVDQKTHRLNVLARRDGRLADTFSLSSNTGVTVTLSLITDMMRAAKTGEIA